MATPSEMELLVRKEVAARLRIWGVVGAIVFVALSAAIGWSALTFESRV